MCSGRLRVFGRPEGMVKTILGRLGMYEKGAASESVENECHYYLHLLNPIVRDCGNCAPHRSTSVLTDNTVKHESGILVRGKLIHIEQTPQRPT